MIRFLVLLTALLALARSQTTEVSQCVSNAGELPINAYIRGCETPPCLLPQLQDAIVDIVFRAPRTMRSMRTLATAYMLFIPIPYNLEENAVTCNFLQNSFCPVMEGEVLIYQLRMYIESIFPVGTQVPIEFRVVDEQSVPILCLRAVIRITEPLSQARNTTVVLTEQ